MLTSDVPQPYTVLETSTNTPPSVLSQQGKSIVSAGTPQQRSRIEQLSWEYLMPKRKERMAGYIRESDPSLADSTTIESQAKAVLAYGQKEGYIYDVAVHEYREAISAYMVHYMERPRLLKLLEAAKRREFDVLVVTEVRAVSRRQVEVFIIYDMLQKYNVRLETIKEKFEDDAMGRLILGFRAAYAEIEREQSYIRTQRGRKDRIEIGQAPNAHSKAAYGYSFIDTAREVKGGYAFDHTIIYTDAQGNAWSPYKVVIFIFEKLKEGMSLTGLARLLNDMGIPTPKRLNRKKQPGYWQRGSIASIITNPIYIGKVYANRFITRKNAKGNMQSVKRNPSEWILLPDGVAPPLIDEATWHFVQEQLAVNKEDSIRNNAHPKEQLGILRAGYIYCGICGCRMHVMYPSPAAKLLGGVPLYSCTNKNGSTATHGRHRVQIGQPYIDRIALEKIREVVQHPEWVRARVEELRQENKPPVISATDIEETIAHIRQAMQNLFNLAQNATDDETMATFPARMNTLETQKREAEAMLYTLEDEEAGRAELEKEIVKFETWVEEIRPFLTDPSYVPSYTALRLAVRIIGIRATVYPTQGEWPFRFQIDATIPAIMKKLGCVNSRPRLLRPISA